MEDKTQEDKADNVAMRRAMHQAAVQRPSLSVTLAAQTRTRTSFRSAFSAFVNVEDPKHYHS